MEKTCKSKSFKSFMLTQGLGAFNDNIFKIVFSLHVVNLMLSKSDSIEHLIIINFCFVTPFILFATISGSIADKFSKSKLIKIYKGTEIILMILAGTFFYYSYVPALFVILFLMGTQSTFFSPVKYGLIPETISNKEISKANGYLELWTFFAIILGTGFSGYIVHLYVNYKLAPGIALLIGALVGFFSSFFITKTSPKGANLKIAINPFRSLSVLKEIKSNRQLYLTILALSYFWGVAVLFQLNIILYGKKEAGMGDVNTSLLMLALGVGIGIGSVLAGKISEGKVELGLVPLGSIGITFSSLLISFSVNYFYLSLFFFFLSGLSSGIFVVPLTSYLQKKSPKDKLGSYLASANFCFFSCMLLSSVFLLIAIDYLKLLPSSIFLLISFSTLICTFLSLKYLPEMFFRCLNWILVHTFYKVNIKGLENLPKKEGALLICNHVSYVDAQLILAATDRSVRYLMYRPIYENKIINYFAKAMRAVPVEAGGDKQKNIESLKLASKAIDDNHLVCIFAEGQISRDGELNPFKRGLEIIMDGTETDKKIIPVAIKQLYGSIFSFEGGKFFFKKPKKVPYPVEVIFGNPLEKNTTKEEVFTFISNELK